MKYIKKFESTNELDIQVGDYVLIDTKKIEKSIYRDYKGLSAYDEMKALKPFFYAISNDINNNKGKIIDIDDTYGVKYYEVEFFNKRTYNVAIDKIKRKMTPKDIEAYQTKINLNKFNI